MPAAAGIKVHLCTARPMCLDRVHQPHPAAEGRRTRRWEQARWWEAGSLGLRKHMAFPGRHPHIRAPWGLLRPRSCRLWTWLCLVLLASGVTWAYRGTGREVMGRVGGACSWNPLFPGISGPHPPLGGKLEGRRLSLAELIHTQAQVRSRCGPPCSGSPTAPEGLG